MKKLFWALALMFTTVNMALSQVNLNIDWGYEGLYSSSVQEPEQIREDNYEKYVFVNSFRINVMPEIMLSKRFSIMSGLRFSYNQGVFKNKKGEYDNNDNIMYWLSDSRGADVYYYSIDAIRQKTMCIGVPVAGKFNIRGNDVFFSPFIKVGGSLNFGINNKYDAVMSDSKMSKHKSEIEDAMADDNIIYGSAWGSAGLQLGTKQKFAFEVIIPTFLFGTHTAFADVNWGFGGAVSWIIPLSKSNN